MCTHIYTNTAILIRQKTPTNDSEHEPSDDNEDDWSYHSEKGSGSKKIRRDKVVTNSPRRGTTSRGPGRPSKQSREMEEVNLSKVSILNSFLQLLRHPCVYSTAFFATT